MHVSDKNFIYSYEGEKNEKNKFACYHDRPDAS